MLSKYNKSFIEDKYYNNFVKNKRIAIVGPSNNTKDTNQGTYIDSFDLVVRLNKTFDIPKKLQNDIGSKISILYNSMNTTDHPGENNINHTRIRSLLKNGIKYISSPYPLIYPYDTDISNFMRLNKNFLPFHIININLYKILVSNINTRPYTGTSAIFDLLSFDIKELYITGIDCYINKYYKEYRNIKKTYLKHLRNNTIHNSYRQLLFLKQLSLNDNRIKLDEFLRNYFFKNEYKLYKQLKLKNYLYNLSSNKDITKSIDKLHIIYTNKTIKRNDFFIINLSINYQNIDKASNMFVNINNNTIKHLQINNDIDIFLDFNENLKILNSIKNNTDISNIYYVNNDLLHYLKKETFTNKLSIIFISIVLLIHLFDKIIYIDKDLCNNINKDEYTMLLYYQYLKKIRLINIQ